MPYMLDMLTRASKEAYKHKERTKGGRKIEANKEADHFRETFSREVPIHFVGIWDTVSSVGWIYDPVKLLFDGQNPAIRKGRHAVSVDEKRCFFQNNLWGPPLERKDNPFLPRYYAHPEDQQQDIVEAWFPGVHSDVGGSYLQEESAPAFEAFKWILEEAKADGLQVQHEKYDAVLDQHHHEWGHGPGQEPRKFPTIWENNERAKPNVKIHKSLHGPWLLLEVFPHTYFDAHGKERWNFVPWPHRREIPDKALIHPELRRWLDLKEPRYKPKNLEKKNISDYTPVQLDLHHPEVMQTLTEEKFGVYNAPKPSRTGPALAVMALLGAAYLVARKRSGSPW